MLIHRHTLLVQWIHLLLLWSRECCSAECVVNMVATSQYTTLSSFSLHVEPAPHLLLPLLDHLYLPRYKSPTVLLDMHRLTCGISSLLHSILSTLFCSLSSWFTSSCAYHLITFPVFTLTIYHSLRHSFTPVLKPVCFTNLLLSMPLPFMELDSDHTWCFSFYFYLLVVHSRLSRVSQLLSAH